MKHLGILLLLSSSFVLASTLSTEPTQSSLIVYNDGFGLVHESRDLSLEKDDKEIIYSPVAKSIIIDSVNISLPKEVTLYSSQYRYDQLNLSKLLEAHIGKIVKVQRDEFTLMSYQANTALLKDKKEQIISVEVKDISFNSTASSLLTKPSLVFNIQTRKTFDDKVQINYLIKNLSWRGNYTLSINGNIADLIGWISIDNRSGKAYNNTRVHVLAGDVNLATQKVNTYARDMVLAKSAMHEAHEGYHFYSVDFGVDIKDQETTQIKFLEKKALDITRLYKTQTSNPLELNSQIKHNVEQIIKMQKLDAPLPKGVVRSYSPLRSQNIFIGEAQIEHTPKQTSLELCIGNSFDLDLKESLISRSDTKEFYDVSVEYTLKNSSDEDKTIEILVSFNKQNSSSINSKEKFSYTQGNLVTFKIKVEANQQKSFSVNFKTKKIQKG